MERNKATALAREFYNPGTVKFGILRELLAADVPMGTAKLQAETGAVRINPRILEIEAETGIEIERTVAWADGDTTRPSTFYSVEDEYEAVDAA